ncbi:disease resistance protein Roq1-like [Prosopis cineraria]|uniref:disease resistance protein Roq1-like n=1 Tax=Prosopis cineraria TaxID=364024 RepID=UPI00240F976E|nr:disease resistance protein Roq1-like [Prosopis cineraria]
MKSRVEEVEQILDLSSDDEVQGIGICGMGGSGKSSIALVLYLKILHFFDSFCFLPNVSRRLKHGDLSLQELIHRNLETADFCLMYPQGEEFLKRLRKHKVLIVLDGVDHVQDIEELNLIAKSICFGRGSRIIITTRDVQVLEMSGVEKIYRPKLLSKKEGSIIFRSIAFPKDYPVNDFQEMIDKERMLIV